MTIKYGSKSARKYGKQGNSDIIRKRDYFILRIMLFFITQTKTFVVSFLKEKICILLIQSRGRRLIKVCVIICLTQP